MVGDAPAKCGAQQRPAAQPQRFAPCPVSGAVRRLAVLPFGPGAGLGLSSFSTSALPSPPARPRSGNVIVLGRQVVNDLFSAACPTSYHAESLGTNLLEGPGARLAPFRSARLGATPAHAFRLPSQCRSQNPKPVRRLFYSCRLDLRLDLARNPFSNGSGSSALQSPGRTAGSRAVRRRRPLQPPNVPNAS